MSRDVWFVRVPFILVPFILVTFNIVCVCFRDFLELGMLPAKMKL